MADRLPPIFRKEPVPAACWWKEEVLLIAIYARQSIERPDSVSIEAQIHQCMQAAGGDVRIYADAGYSGKNTNRPEFERMMQDLRNRKITAVISYRLDRISRNIVDFAGLLSIFEQYDVKYVSATEQFDTSTPMGRAMIYIVMVFAQLERETIATRISDNYRYRAAQGLFMGGNTPFGYDSRRVMFDGRRVSVLEPNAQAEILQTIFQKFVCREPLSGISRELNARGAKTAKGNLWSPAAVKRVLQNISPCPADEPLYHFLTDGGYAITNSQEEFDGRHGMCLFFKNRNRNQPTEPADQIAVIGLHPPLISSDQFLRAQRILQETVPILHGKRSERSFLAGLIRCGECGHSFGIKYTASGGRDYAYYRCRGRERGERCRNGAYLPAKELEREILRRCRAHLAHLDLRQTQGRSQDALRRVEEAGELRRQIGNLIDGVGKGSAAVDSLLTQKITFLQDRLALLASVPPDDLEKVNSASWVLRQLEHFSALEVYRQADILRSLIRTITVSGDGRVEIEFLF